jgi:hypothetical protein
VGLFRAVVDANVLYPMPVADTVLSAAENRFARYYCTGCTARFVTQRAA